MSIESKVLGPLEVVVDGVPVSIPSGRARSPARFTRSGPDEGMTVGSHVVVDSGTTDDQVRG